MKLTPNFSLSEMADSDRAAKAGIPNHPNQQQIEALTLLCLKTLEPIREKIGKPVIVTSGYRSPKLNKLVGGSKSSQHLKGEAADIKVSGLTPQQLFETIIESGIRFDQIIQEFDQWVHISFAKTRERRSMLYAVRDSTGRTVYKKHIPATPLQKAVALLRELHDLENKPLSEMHAPEWAAAMGKVDQFLKEHEK